MKQALAERQPLQASSESLRILLAEDEGQMRRLLAQVLERDGHEVMQVRDGGALLEALASNLIDRQAPRFDLVILRTTASRHTRHNGACRLARPR